VSVEVALYFEVKDCSLEANDDTRDAEAEDRRDSTLDAGRARGATGIVVGRGKEGLEKTEKYR
jgi:hypothetical protein